MEYCDGWNLRKFLLEKYQSFEHFFPTKKYFAVKVCLDYINALTEVRSKMITNRDIKPDNIMVKVTEKG